MSLSEGCQPHLLRLLFGVGFRYRPFVRVRLALGRIGDGFQPCIFGLLLCVRLGCDPRFVVRFALGIGCEAGFVCARGFGRRLTFGLGCKACFVDLAFGRGFRVLTALFRHAALFLQHVLIAALDFHVRQPAGIKEHRSIALLGQGQPGEQSDGGNSPRGGCQDASSCKPAKHSTSLKHETNLPN